MIAMDASATQIRVEKITMLMLVIRLVLVLHPGLPNHPAKSYRKSFTIGEKETSLTRF